MMSKTVDKAAFPGVVSCIRVKRELVRASDGCCSAVEGAEDLTLLLPIISEMESTLL